MPIDDIHYLNNEGLDPIRKVQETYYRELVSQYV